MKRTLFGLLSVVAILFSVQTATAGVIGPFSATAEGTASIEGDELTLDTDVIFQDPDSRWKNFFYFWIKWVVPLALVSVLMGYIYSSFF